MKKGNVPQKFEYKEDPFKADDKDPDCLTNEHDTWSRDISWRMAVYICCCSETGRPQTMGELCGSLPLFCLFRCGTGSRHIVCDSAWRIQNRLSMCCAGCGALANACCCCKEMSGHDFVEAQRYACPIGSCEEKRLRAYADHGYKHIVDATRPISVFTPLIQDSDPSQQSHSAPPSEAMSCTK